MIPSRVPPELERTSVFDFRILRENTSDPAVVNLATPATSREEITLGREPPWKLKQAPIELIYGRSALIILLQAIQVLYRRRWVLFPSRQNRSRGFKDFPSKQPTIP